MKRMNTEHAAARLLAAVLGAVLLAACLMLRPAAVSAAEDSGVEISSVPDGEEGSACRVVFDAGSPSFDYDGEYVQYITILAAPGGSLDFDPTVFLDTEGRGFEGWYTTKDYQEGTLVTNVSGFTAQGNMTMYAKWSEDGYRVTYDACGGYLMKISNSAGTLDGDSSATGEEKGVRVPSVEYLVPEGATLEYSMPNGEPKKDSDEVFTGWYTDPECTAESRVEDLTAFVPEEDTTFYAGWAESCTLTFDANGGYFARVDDGSATTVSLKFLKGIQVDESPIAYANYYPISDEGMNFTYWYTDPGCAEADRIEDFGAFVPEEDTTFYAGWEKAEAEPEETETTAEAVTEGATEAAPAASGSGISAGVAVPVLAAVCAAIAGAVAVMRRKK